MDNDKIVGIDSWNSSVTDLIYDELGLSNPENKDSNDHLLYEIDGSDAFSRIYSKLSRSTKFDYVDNESSYSYTIISLVFSCEYGKIILTTNLDTDSYTLEVVR